MRRLIIAIALLIGVIFLLTRLGEVQTAAVTLQQGDWRFVILALGVQAAWQVTVAAVYRSIYRRLGMSEKIERLTLLAASANFVNVIAPTAGMGGMAVFVADGRRRGYPTARVTLASVLFALFDYIAFICILVVGLVVLYRRSSLNVPQIGASLFLVLLAAVLALLLYLGAQSGDRLGRVLAGLVRLVNRGARLFRKHLVISEGRAYAFAREAADGLRLLQRAPTGLIAPLALAVISKALLMGVLLLMFLAFNVPLTFGTLVASFSIAYLFLIVSPTPAGIGVVEGMLALALSSLYVPLGAAAVLALAYRGITFWAPLFVGMLSFRWLSHAHR